VIFVDTGAFLARHLRSDQFHASATKAWGDLRRRGWRLATSNFVLDETFTLLGRRASYPFAAERARRMLLSKSFVVMRPEAEDELEALRLFEKFADQRVSFTDCVSFALMRRRGIERAFTFDAHFERAGFTVWPAL
jgi:predicted nucleic acid-binding protein